MASRRSRDELVKSSESYFKALRENSEVPTSPLGNIRSRGGGGERTGRWKRLRSGGGRGIVIVVY